MEGTEKIYCTDRGSDAMAYLAGMNGNRGCDPMAMAAMMNSQNNDWNNNPFAYLIWLVFAMRMFNGNGWDGNGCAQGNLTAQLDSLRNQMSDNQNSGLIMDAIKGNATAIGQLASNLNCDFNQLQSAICCVKSAIEQVGGQIGFTGERVINAVNTGLERGFANVAFEAQAQTCQLINAGNANTQRIIDTLNCHWNQELQQKYQDARLELSQQRQNQFLISQLKTTTTATA